MTIQPGPDVPRANVEPVPHGARPLRMAWLGPAPEDVGGVPSMARQTLLALADRDVELELFLDSGRTPFLDELSQRRNVRITAITTGWDWRRWYSSTPLTALASSTVARAHVGMRLAERLVARHGERPFDVVYRFSQIELLALRRRLRQLPPVVLHPEVHAEGERRHHWRERALALRCESPATFALSHAYLAYRAQLQRRDLRHVALLVAPSARFADHVAADYGFPRERARVLPNVIDLDRFHPAAEPPPPAPVRLLFVSRMSVRKGVEQIVALSHRLADLAGQVRIECLGGASLFSNYRGLLSDLNPAVARVLPALPPTELPDLYRAAHGLLQPSWYEPYALTVGEALASGLPVVVSDEVGAAEGVDPRACRRHAAGDIVGLEREVRRLVAELRDGRGPALGRIARSHAETRLSRDTFAHDLVALLSELRVPAFGGPR